MLAVGEKHPNMQSFAMSRKRFNSNSQKSGQEPIMTTIWKYSGSNQVDSSSSTLPPNSVSNLSTLIYIVRSSFNSSSIVLRKKHLKKLENLPPLLCCPSNRAALEFNNHFISRNSRSVPAIQEAKCPLFCLAKKNCWGT